MTMTIRQFGGLHTLRVELEADVSGQFPETPLPPAEGFFLCIRTFPGSPAPSAFRVRLLEAGSEYDCIEGAGERLPVREKGARLIRYEGCDVHPTFAETDRHTLVVDGNATPGARLAVSITWGTDVELEDILLTGS